MTRKFGRFWKKTISLLLTAALLAGSAPQTSLYSYAAEQEAPETKETLTEKDEAASPESASADQSEAENKEISASTSLEQEEAQTEPADTTEASQEQSTTETQETSAEESTEEAPQEQSTTETQTAQETSAEETTVTETENETIPETEAQSETVAETAEEIETETEEVTFGEGEEEYPIDTTKYTLTDVTMTPDKYTAAFSAKCNTSESKISEFYVVYTTDEQAAKEFFAGKDFVLPTDFGFLQKAVKYEKFLNWSASKDTDEYTLHGDFGGEKQYLEPNTTYYYRIAYFKEFDGTPEKYNFLTALHSFKTLEEPSNIKFTNITTEIVNYNQVKVIWTVENTENEPIVDNSLYLYYANKGEAYFNKIRASQYENDSNRYYCMVPTQGKELNVKFQLEVKIEDPDKPNLPNLKVTHETEITPHIPPEESACSIQFLEPEDVTYNELKAVWVIDNPWQEYIIGKPEVYCANEGEEYQTYPYEGINYRDEDGTIVPDKYYCTLYTKGKKLNVKVVFTVYGGEENRKIELETEITPYIPPETSAVTMKDFTIEEIGYNTARIVWTVENPEEEWITKKPKLQDQYSGSWEGMPYKDKDGNLVPNKYYCDIETKGEQQTVKLQWEVFRGEKNKTYTSELEITPYSIDDSTVTCEVNYGTTFMQAAVKIDPWYTIDSQKLHVYIYYRKANSEQWQTSSASIPADSVIVPIIGTLLPETEYEYYIYISAGYSNAIWSDGSAVNPKTFTTKKIKTYNEQDFPDPVFRSSIRKALNLADNDSITSDKLETLKRLDCSRGSSVTENIASIEGIQYIENLTYIRLDGHVITDANMMSSLSCLEYIYMRNNDLAELPDLSNMYQLSTADFDFNKITEKSFSTQKLPKKFLQNKPNWISDTIPRQRGEFAVTAAPKYYAIGDKHPFIIMAQGLKYTNKNTLTATIDGINISLEAGYGTTILFCLEDLSALEGFTVTTGKEYTISSITLTDGYGNQYEVKQPYKFIFAEDEPYMEKEYTDISQKQVHVDIDLPSTIEKENIKSIVLQDSSKNKIETVGLDKLSISKTSSNENRYEDIFHQTYITGLTRQITNINGNIEFAKYLSAGNYDIVITMKDDKTYCLENVIEVVGKDIALLTSLSLANNYDNYGNNLHVKLYGMNLDSVHIYPVFYEGGTVITEIISAELHSDYSSPYILYTLKKLYRDKYWQPTETTIAKQYSYRLEADPDYPFIDNISWGHTITLNYSQFNRNCILFNYYNCKKGVYEVHVDSSVPEGQSLLVYLYADKEHTTLKATAGGRVKNAQLSLKFKDAKGMEYVPPDSQMGYFIYEYRDDSHEKLGSFTHDAYVRWYNYSWIHNSSDYTMYERSGIKELKLNVSCSDDEIVDQTRTIEAQIYAANGDAKGDYVVLTPAEVDGKIMYTGMWQSSQGLDEGIYTIRYTQDTKEIYKSALYVYDNEKFYMSSQSMQTDNEGTYISITSEQLKGEYYYEHQGPVSDEQAMQIWNQNYTIEIFDKLHNQVLGWNIKSVKRFTNAFRIDIENLPEEYTGYYVRITHKTKGLGELLGTGKTFYSQRDQADEAYGKWETIFSASPWNGWRTSDTNVYIGFSTHTLDVFPITVTIAKPYDTEMINRFVVASPDQGNSYSYSFTNGDLLGTNQDEVYEVVLNGVDGRSTSAIAYLGTKDQSGSAIPATGISLDKTELTLSAGQSVTLKASIQPENATNQYIRWTSSRPSVAKVDRETGRVTALQAGETTITATTHNNKKASCIVTVSESLYHLSEVELAFDLSEAAQQPKTVTVYEGDVPVSDIVWSSGDEKVATVTKKEDGSGLITPVGVGTTQIQAVTPDKTVLTCSVTVTASVTGISLNKQVLNLRVSQSEKLIASITPESAAGQKLTWRSSNPEIASVDDTGNVTAWALGTALITVTAQNGLAAECSVTVSNYEISQSELTFQLGEGNPNTAVLSVRGAEGLVKEVVWSSDHEEVAAVTKNEDGSAEVTALRAGTAKIEAKMPDGDVLYCIVTVLADTVAPEYPVTDIILDKTSIVLTQGQSEQLTAKILPENATDQKITWTSSDERTASVDDTGKVTAKAVGEAVITAASANNITASCTVRVMLEKPELSALVNVQKTLADIALPAGWIWVYPDISLEQFAGTQKKSFAAVYQPDQESEPYRTSLKVQLTKVNSISIAAKDQKNGAEKGVTMRKDTKAALQVQFYDSSQEIIENALVSTYLKEVLWSSTKEAAASVHKDEAGVMLSANGKGKANIKAEISLGGKLYKAQYAVTVVEGEIAEIRVTSIENFAVEGDGTENDAYYYHSDDTLGGVSSTMQVTVTNAAKLTAKSSNPSVAAVGKIAGADGSFQIPLTVKSTGTAKVTLTANDEAKTTKEIWLHITDPTPNLSESTIAVNTLQTTGTAVSVYVNPRYPVSNVALSGASQFTMVKDDTETDQYFIQAAEGVAKGTYKAEITADVNNKTYTMPLTIKVAEQAPSYKVKQKSKVNLFYNNPIALLEITTEEEIEAIALTGCDFTVEKLDENYYIAAKNGVALNGNKNGELQLTFAGYKPFSVRYTVGVENKVPKLSLSGKTMTLYPNAGISDARITVLANNTPLDLENVRAELENTDRCSLVKEGNELVLTAKDLSKAASFQEKIIVKSENWTKEVVLPCTVKVNMGKPSVKLEKAVLQLNKNEEVYAGKESFTNKKAALTAHDSAATAVMWKNAFHFSPQEISVMAGNAKSQVLLDSQAISFETSQNQVIAKLYDTAAAKGSYRFTVSVKATETCTVTAPLTVQVVDVALQKAVKVSMKGSIDLMNRKGSYVTATPSLKSVNGTIMDISLTGRAAHLFRAVYDQDKVYIYAKEDEALITKYNYSVALKLTLRTAEGRLVQITSPVMKLKLKQSKAKITAAPKSAVFYSGAYNSVKVKMKASLNGVPNPAVTNVQLINNTNAFSYHFSQGKLTLKNTGEAVKGKTYTLQFRVTLNGQADNESTVIVKYQVKVR